jgi:hypothetical protein
MNIQDRRVSRGFGRARRPLSDEDIENDFRLALQWREDWRGETAAAEVVSTPPERAPDRKDRREAFARGIARLEFGRAYWDDRRAQALRRDAERPPRVKRRD